MIPVMLLLAACETPGVPPMSDGPLVVTAQEDWRLEIDALYPTDLLPQKDGGLWVLDGYADEIQRFDASRRELVPVALPNWTRPVRMTPATNGGVWLTDPHGTVFRVDVDGSIAQEISETFDNEQVQPISVLELNGSLLVGDRDGRILRVDPETGETRSAIELDDEGAKLGVITDLVATADGRVLGVDTLRTAVHTIEGDQITHHWGRFGMWAGTLMKPKAIALGPDGTVLVADSALDVVQIFSVEGKPLGMLADADGEPLRFEHVVAIETLDPTSFLVLDSGAASVVKLTVSVDDVAAARDTALSTRALRYTLREQGDAGVAGKDGDTCLQCHDGLVNDDRQHWDKRFSNHPVDIVPDVDIPAFFPLDEQGEIRCNTCHSPHGSAEPADVAAVTTEEQRIQLVRHVEQDEFFTRLTRGDSALCEACHTDAAHDDAIARLEISGSVHPVGKELEQALEKRRDTGEDTGGQVEKGCLACHAPHAAEGDTLLRGTADGKACFACHEQRGDTRTNHPLGREGDRPKPRDGAHIPLDDDGRVACTSCHALVGGTPAALLRSPQDGGVLCIACHVDRKVLMESAHAKVKGDQSIPCLGCHAVHDEDDEKLLRTRSTAKGDPEGCLSCHGDGKRYSPRGASPGKRGHPADGRTHGDRDDSLGCTTCHDPHDPDPVACDTCHAEQVTERDRGGHGSAECLDCHPAHNDPPLVKIADLNPQAWRCLACHGEERGATDAPKVGEYEHPVPVFKPDGTRWKPLGSLPLFAPDGTAQPLGENGDLTCTTCHRVHGPDPTTPKTKLKRPGWEEACSACHGGDALPLYRYFHQPDRRVGIEVKNR